MNETINVLLDHVSIRKFIDKDIEEDKKNLIIECGQMAPTSSHFQAYTIIEVQDKIKTELLYEISGKQKWILEAPLVLLFCADLNRGKKYYEEIDTEILSNVESYTVSVFDTALALEKTFVAAQSLGLGGVVVGGIRNDVKAVSEAFRLPDLVAPMCLLCLGYPDHKPEKKPRLPQREIHKINFYDDREQNLLIDEYNDTVKEYYIKRTKGKLQDTWTIRCGYYLSEKPRYSVGTFFKKIGLLRK